MSDIELNTTKSNDCDNEFNMGIKTIVKAYEKHNEILYSEINKLNEELKEKNKKISEIEEFCSKLLNEKKSCENKINDLTLKLEKLKNQFDHIIQENNDLIKMKQVIIETIDNKKSPKAQNYKFNPILNGGNYINTIKFDNYINNTNKGNNKFINQQSFKSLLNKKKKFENLNILSEKNKSHSMEKIQSKIKTNSIYENINPSRKNNHIYLELDNINISTNNINNNNYNNKDKNDFFQNCRSNMNPSQYKELINIVHNFNSNQISKKDMYNLIIEKLQNYNYDNLIEEFNKLFS